MKLGKVTLLVDEKALEAEGTVETPELPALDVEAVTGRLSPFPSGLTVILSTPPEAGDWLRQAWLTHVEPAGSA